MASKPDARLREMHFGDWEGRRWDAIAKADIDAWTADFADHAPGGGEALRSMLVRVDAALQAARQHAQARLAAGAASAPTVWITHAGVARCVSWLLQPAHTPPKTLSAAQWPTAAPGFGQWMQVNL